MKKIIILIGLIAVLTCCNSSVYAGDKINIDVNGKTLTATLADNSSAQAFAQMLSKGSVTIEMSDYGNFEKVGSLGTTLPRNDEYITTEPGDLILYQGNSITIYYDVNSWNFTRLGKIDDITQSELKAVLGEGDVTVVFSLPETEEKFIYGDADCDGIIAANDAAVVIQKVCADTYKLPIEDKTSEYMKYIDVDGDKKIGNTDGVHILHKVLMRTYIFPCEK
ncbi:MAG: hypothetical protein IJ736_14785 [Firmicutes bacterium]|nr:hypothetical protein [Bacillota bacterium]